MDIESPCVDTSHEKPRLHMFCPETRIPREIFWAGFGFQVWCQMLTHLIQSGDKSLFMIDEPDIYLHSDLQRQLLGLLRNLGPDIIIAIHSTEIISEADSDDIILINKSKRDGKRIKHPSQLWEVFSALGSNLNPILTQLAKTRRAVFVEGDDFQVISKFAQKLGFSNVGNRSDFAVLSAKGFNPERIRSLKAGMEFTLGGKIAVAAIFDRDYRSDGYCAQIERECLNFCDYVTVHKRKEIENFLLVPEAIDRAAARKVHDRSKRAGNTIEYRNCAADIIANFAAENKAYVMAQYLEDRRQFEKTSAPNIHGATINEAALLDFEQLWTDAISQRLLIPGKKALSALNCHFQKKYNISLTSTAIIESMQVGEVPVEMKRLIHDLSAFSDYKVEAT